MYELKINGEVVETLTDDGPVITGRYVVKCDDCKIEMRRTDSLHESACGGRCESCRAEIVRYYADRDYRLSLPCGECGKTGGCAHFPTEVAAMREP